MKKLIIILMAVSLLVIIFNSCKENASHFCDRVQDTIRTYDHINARHRNKIHQEMIPIFWYTNKWMMCYKLTWNELKGSQLGEKRELIESQIAQAKKMCFWSDRILWLLYRIKTTEVVTYGWPNHNHRYVNYYDKKSVTRSDIITADSFCIELSNIQNQISNILLMLDEEIDDYIIIMDSIGKIDPDCDSGVLAFDSNFLKRVQKLRDRRMQP